jgi:subtilase family serine protease
MIKRIADTSNAGISFRSVDTQRREKTVKHANIVFLSFTTLSILFLTAALLVQYSVNVKTSVIPRQNNGGNIAIGHWSKEYNSSQAAKKKGLSPQNLWSLYHLPGLSGGQGQLIAEVIDGGMPTLESDLDAYSRQFGLPACTTASGCLNIQYQGGSKIATGYDPAEGLLDVELMHAIAPQAHILVYIMHSNNTSIAEGPGQIINTPKLKAINMSYGFDGNGQNFETSYNDNPDHVALFASSGDDGYANISPPSIYPEVIAVGGTVVNGTTESAWSGSGGGLSMYYSEPTYQMTYGIPKADGHRGNPDVAAVAGSPVTTYEQGRWYTEEGTSVSSPIWTGIAALVNKPITNSLLYKLAKSQPDSFNSITTGSNGKCGYYCTARAGYNYITGLGTPKNFVANVNAMP